MPFVFMVENEKNSLNKEAWWKPGMAIFMQMSVYIVVPILVSFFVGKKWDNLFDTEPLLFIVSMSIAFTISIIAIVRVSKKYIEEIEQEARQKAQQLKEKDVNRNNK